MRYILLLFVILISYGSLYPFRFSGDLLPTTELIEWLFNLSYRTTKADIIANIMLFVPYGFVSVMGLSTSRHPLYHAVMLLVLGALLAFVLQYLQFYLPARVPAAGDAWYNSLGIICGMLIAHIIKQYSQNHLPTEQSKKVNWSQITIPLVLALLWVAWRLFPFIPLITTKSLLAAISPLMVQPELNLAVIIRDCIGWLVFFHLLTRPPFDRLPRFRIFKFMLYIFGLEILIRGNVLSVNDLLAALFAFALFSSVSGDKLKQGLINGLAIAIVLTLIESFTFPPNYNDFLWLPFSSLLKGNPWANGEDLILRIYLYASFLYLLSRTWLGWRGASLLTVTLLLLISVVQIFIGTNNSEITDPLLVGLIAWAMSQVEKSASEERAMILGD